MIARRFCQESGEKNAGGSHLHVVGLFLLIANALGFFVIPAIARAVTLLPSYAFSPLPVFVIVSALLGTTLPLVAHFGIPPDDRVGSRLSYVYLANIIGSAAGSLTTGFVLLDIFSLQQLAVFLVLLGLLCGGLLAVVPAGGSRRRRVVLAAVVIATAVFMIAIAPPAYEGIYDRLQYKTSFEPGRRFVHVIEGKSGVVATSTSENVYGGGSYDGNYNVDPLPDGGINRIIRAFAVAAIHPMPKDVLMIGIGSGSWLQVVANHPAVESVVAIEINPGYVEMMKRYPEVAGAVDNPRVEIVIDDGRRFMQRTDRKFDLIVQNTIVYWRGHATNTLSREHLEIVRSRLKPGGVLYFNTTASTAVQKTGAIVFPHAWRFQNMLAASDTPIEIDRSRWRAAMMEWRIDGKPVVDISRDREALIELIAHDEFRGEPAWEDRESILTRTADEPIVTDDNMVTEWRARNTFP